MGQTSVYMASLGASRGLSNLASVAINTALLPDTNATYDFGSNGARWNNCHVDGNVSAGKFIEQSTGLDITDVSKNNQGTGLLSGGVVSIASSTTLDITAGTGQFIDYSDPLNPVLTKISWNANLGYTPDHLATDGQYVLAYNSAGVLSEIHVDLLTTQDTRDYILIGAFATRTSNISTFVDTPSNLGYNGLHTAKDFIRNVIGPANILGNIISANGANLSIDNTGGTVFVIGSNFRINPEVPDERMIAASTPMTYFRVLREASPSTVLTSDGAGPVTVLDPGKWDDGSGSLAALGSNKYTVQVVYVDPRGNYIVAFGQEVFNSLASAETAILNGTLNYDEYPILTRIVRRCFIAVKSNGDELNNPAHATFIADHKFRNGGLAVSGGLPGINIPGDGDTSVQFNDLGAFGGDTTFVFNSTTKSLGVGITGSLTADATLEVAGTTGAFLLSRLTTSERDALTAANGMMIYNTTTNLVNFRENGSWVSK